MGINRKDNAVFVIAGAVFSHCKGADFCGSVQDELWEQLSGFWFEILSLLFFFFSEGL